MLDGIVDSQQTYLSSAVTVPISSSSGTVTIRAGQTGRRYVLLHLLIQAGATTNLTFNSGATALTGAIAVTTTTPLELRNDGVPVLTGRKLAEAITITNSAPAALEGFAVLLELEDQDQ